MNCDAESGAFVESALVELNRIVRNAVIVVLRYLWLHDQVNQGRTVLGKVQKITLHYYFILVEVLSEVLCLIQKILIRSNVMP